MRQVEGDFSSPIYEQTTFSTATETYLSTGYFNRLMRKSKKVARTLTKIKVKNTKAYKAYEKEIEENE